MHTFCVSPSRRIKRITKWEATIVETSIESAYISRSKKKYMECKFSQRHTNPSLEVKINSATISQVLKYLGSIIQNDGEIKEM